MVAEDHMEKPDDTEDHERDDADELGVDTNDLGESIKLLLEGRERFLDLQSILIVF